MLPDFPETHVSLSLPVLDSSAVGEARRRVMAFSERLGFNETDRGRVALVVTEMGTNLDRHGQGGHLWVRPLLECTPPGIELLAVDAGPGMEDVGRCLQDGYSTAGSAGKGLGGIQRLADFFDLYSLRGKGTVLLARLFPRVHGQTPKEAFPLGVVCLPYPGEEECGDGWALRSEGGRHAILVVDGLGHGRHAAEAARRAIEVFNSRSMLEPAALMQTLHEQLRGTRGAALTVAQLDLVGRFVDYAGVGNIASGLFAESSSHKLVSQNGTVGFQVPRIQGHRQPLKEEPLFILHSDGLVSRWNLDGYPGIWARHPAIIAAVLARDARRGRDDVTVLVGRLQRQREPGGAA